MSIMRRPHPEATRPPTPTEPPVVRVPKPPVEAAGARGVRRASAEGSGAWMIFMDFYGFFMGHFCGFLWIVMDHFCGL